MAFDYNSIYSKIQNPQIDNQEDSTENEELASMYARLHGGATPKQDEPLGYETNVGQVYDKIDEGVGVPSIRTGKKSLTQLANDEEFSKTSERFLESIGSDDNIFEYLRDSEYSLSSAIVRAKQANKWTDQQQQDYAYLTQQFQNADLKGFKEHFGLIKDLGIDIVFDPLNALALLFAVPSGGATLAGRAALGEAARLGAKQLIKQSVKSSAPLAKISAAEGATWTGLHDYFMQDIAVDTNMIDNIDLNQTAFSTLLGGLAGGALGGLVGSSMAGVQGARYANFVKKEFNHTNNSDIDFTGPRVREEVEKDWKLDQELNVKETLGPEGEITEETIARIDKAKKGTATGLNFLFGKPTSEMVKFVEDEPLIGNFLRKLRYDWDAGLLKEGTEGATKAKLADGTESVRTFGEFYGRLHGKYIPRLAKIFNPLGYDGFFGKLESKANDTLKILLSDKTVTVANIENKLVNGQFSYKAIKRVDGKNVTENLSIDVSPDIVEAYKGLRTLLDEGYVDANNVGLFRTGTIRKAGFFPRLYKYDVLDQNKEEFADILIARGHADPVNKKDLIDIEVTDPDGTVSVIRGSKKGQLGKDEEVFGRNFLDDAKGDENVAKQLKAFQIIDDMLMERYAPFELRKQGKSNANGYLQPRRFVDIEDWEISKFLEDDVETILNNYFTNLSQSIARKKYFGASLYEFDQKELGPIINKMYNAKNKDGSRKYSKAEIDAVKDGLKRIYSRATGLETFSNFKLNKNKYLRNIKDTIILTQQASLLPFATLSSVTEPLILLSRAGGGDGLKVVNDIHQAIKKQTSSSFDRLFKAIERSTGKTTKGFKDLDDEVWDEIHQTGLAFEQAVQERIEGLAGEALGNPLAKRAQEVFFNSNLLAPWTKAVQLASFNTGKRIIKQHAEKLATGKTAYGDLSSGKRKQIIKELRQLGIDENEAVTWYKKSLDKNGLYDDSLAKGINGNGNAEFYSESMLGGANRFTKEIILNPRAAEANRPDWFGRPDAQFLIQFAGYPTVFNNTILKRFINELSPVARDKNKKYGLKYNEGFAHTNPKIIMTTLLMTGVAHLGNEIRSNGKATLDYETGKPKPDGEVIGNAVRRWGGFGPFDYAYRYQEESNRNVGPGTSLMKAIGGPFPQDILDMVLYRKGFGEMFVTNAPYYGAYDTIFGEGTKKKLRAMARGTYKKEDSKFEPLFKYSKGGIVKNVPNVTDEPDEMQSRVTGVPFNSTAEFVQDEEDRALKTQMEGLGLREPLALGGLLGKSGLLFDHTNPLDYLMAVPGLGILGVGAKALSKFKKGSNLRKLPKTQYHGGYSSVDKGMASKTGIYATPDKNYAYAFSKGRAYKDRGKPGLYKLDLSSAKNIELTDKPSKKLLEAVDKKLAILNKKADKVGYKNLSKSEKQLEVGLQGLFKFNPEMGVRGGKGQRPRIVLDFLRKEGIEILTDSKTLQRGLTGKSTKSEYYLLKDFPKRRLSEDEIESLIFSYRKQFNLGGQVNTELKDFLSLALEIHNDEISEKESLGLRKPFVFGGISMLGRKGLMKALTKRINSRADEKIYPTPPESIIVDGKIKRSLDLTEEEKAKLEKEFFESGEAAEFNRLMIEDEMNKFHIKTGKELQDAIDNASEVINMRLQESGMSELDATRLIKKAKKENPDNEMFWAADKDLYNAVSDTVSDRDLLTPAEQANYIFDDFGNIKRKKAIVNNYLERDNLDPSSKLSETMAEFDRLTKQRQEMVDERLAKLSKQDKEKRQELLDEFFGTEKNQGEDGLWDKENTLRSEILEKLKSQRINLQINEIGNTILPEKFKTLPYKKVEKRIKEVNNILEKDFGEYIETFGEGTTGQPTGFTEEEYFLIT